MLETDKTAPLRSCDPDANSDEPASVASRPHLTVAGWVGLSIGTVLSTYGYFATGMSRFINWPVFLPEWVAETLPNAEAELGMLLVLVGCIPVYLEQWRGFRTATGLIRSVPARTHS